MNIENKQVNRLATPRFVIVSLVAATLYGCASQQVTTFPAFQPEDLNSKVQAGVYKQKVDNFLVVMDASSSMNSTYRGTGFPETPEATKFAVEKEFLTRMNQTIPPLNMNSGFRTFGFGSCMGWNFTRLDAPMAAYTRPGFQGTVDNLKCASGGSPIGRALEAAAADLQATQGKVAVIVISDGKKSSGDPTGATRKLKEQYGDRLCLHTVWIGDQEGSGRGLMGSLPGTAGCGTSSVVGDIVSSAGMAGFVEKVFLEGSGGPLDSDGDGVLDPEDQCPGTPKGAKVNAVGCWVLSDVLFDTDRATIQPVSYAELDGVIDVFERNPGLRVEVDGHTDSQGSDAHNQALSQHRANAIRDYLIGKGIAADRLSARGFGESMPIADNDTAEGRAMNRRVELKVLR